MSRKTLVIKMGLPSSGKSTLARMLSNTDDGLTVCTTDDYEGLYSTDDDGSVVFHGGDRVGPKEIPMIVLAHQWNQERVQVLMGKERDVIVVPNTNTQRWEFQPYLDLAEEYGYRVVVASLFDGGLTDEELAARNEHGVPQEVIATMRARYEHDWKNGDPRPPWER